MDMEYILDTIIKLCDKISLLIKSDNSKLFNDTGYIGYGGDKTKQIDKIAENILIDNLKEFGNIYSEEVGFLDFNKPYTFVIDPIDGSDNFIAKIPFFAISIAIKYKNNTIFGFIYDLNSNKFFYRFNKKLKIISYNKVSNFGIFERAYTRCDICMKLRKKKLKFRSYGSIALSLTYSRGVLFVLIAGDIREFDIEAGLFINKDLFRYQNDEFILISQNEAIFEMIKKDIL